MTMTLGVNKNVTCNKYKLPNTEMLCTVITKLIHFTRSLWRNTT